MHFQSESVGDVTKRGNDERGTQVFTTDGRQITAPGAVGANVGS